MTTHRVHAGPVRAAGAFLRWLFAGPWFAVTPQIVVLGLGAWLIAGAPGPGRYDDTPMLHGPERLTALVAGTVMLLGLVAYWQLNVRRDEPPRIRSRWDRRRG